MKQNNNNEQQYDKYGGNWTGCEITPRGFGVTDFQKWANVPEMKELVRKFKKWGYHKKESNNMGV